jgi:plastocyanin
MFASRQSGSVPAYPRQLRPMAAAAVLSAVLLVLGVTSAVGAKELQVGIRNHSFGPGQLTIVAGDSVTWTNDDSMTHTATADNGAFDTGSIAPGASRTIRFDTAGTFAYHCSIHPDMTATINVIAAGGSTSAPTPAGTQAARSPVAASPGSSALPQTTTDGNQRSGSDTIVPMASLAFLAISFVLGGRVLAFRRVRR